MALMQPSSHDFLLIVPNLNIIEMSAIKLELIHAFGSTCSKGYRNCIAISDE